MPVSFIADIQARNHQSRSRILPNGRNSRLQNALDCLSQAAKHAGPGGTLVINGDLFDDRAKLDIDVLDGVVETILTASKTCRVILNPGNHDQFLKDGRIHSLRMFDGHDGIIVVPQQGGSYVTDDCALWVYPFDEDLEAVKAFVERSANHASIMPNMSKILVLHEPVASAVLGNGEVDSTGLSVTSLRTDVFDHVLLGHYHKPQALADLKVMYIGSPYQVKADERGDEKRFLVCSKGKLQSVPVVGMPKYIKVSSLEEAKKYPDDFVDLICAPTEIESEELPFNVRFAGAPEEVAEETKKQASLANFDLEEAVSVWIKNNSGDPDRAQRLIALARERLI